MAKHLIHRPLLPNPQRIQQIILHLIQLIRQVAYYSNIQIQNIFPLKIAPIIICIPGYEKKLKIKVIVIYHILKILSIDVKNCHPLLFHNSIFWSLRLKDHANARKKLRVQLLFRKHVRLNRIWNPKKEWTTLDSN